MHEEKQTKKWVWVPHNSLTYIPAFINTQTEKEATVTTQDNQTLTLPISKIQKMNPPKFNQADDLAVLSFLNDPSVLYNLKMRYDHDLIYTYSGLFLVAINPYKEIRSLYSKETIESYKNKKQPHIFAIANDAYENMLTNKEDQSILITGESGAGKTVNTKKVITFLAHIANKEQMDSSVTEELIASKILETNHVLEAFGNAQTVKNDNSSRFGKFIKISFVNGKITGCYIEKYLLEKSRITRANSDERNYHIFYYLLEALRKNEKYQRKNSKGEYDNEMNDKNRYQSKTDENSKRSKNYANDLGESSYKYGGNVYDKEYVEFLDVVRKAALFDSVSLNDYKYTKDTQKTINDVDDALEFYKLNRSMDILEFTRDEKISIFKILAVILYLGNLEFKEENDQAYIENEDEAEKICQLLKIPLKRFLNTLLTPTTMAGKDVVINSRTKEQVVNIVEALARLLYERMFDTIIERVNTVLGKEKYYNKTDSNFIGVLDIAGFEIFEKNDFEQLCINFTNEKLQQFFNHHMFILEQEIYKRENIDWDFIDFGLDLQPTIDLIEKSNPIGVLSFLDEECVMPKGSDLTFLDKLREIQDRGNVKARKRVTFSGVNYQVADSSSTSVKTKDEQKTPETLSPYKKQTFELSKLKSGFIIDHYAGRVEYIVDQWLKKNKDPHFDYLAVLLRHSDDAFVSELFTFDTSGKKGFFRTVSQKHKDSLNLLMGTLRKTNPFFVRCILPNNQKKPNLFINSLVLHQLKCNGVMEGIRISRQGYPTRILFKEFRKRYGMLCKEIEDHIDNKEASLTILESVEHCLPCLNENNTDVAISGNEKKGTLSDLYKVGNTMLFFKQGVLAEIEDLRDREIEKIAVEIQSLIRRRLAIYKEHMEEIRSNAVRIIQKNARLSIQFRSWNWWKLYMKVKPLLNISKMEDEIRQKECDFNALNETLKMERMRNEEMVNRMKRETDEKGRLENELENERMIICEKEDLLIALRNEIVKIKDRINDKNSEVEKLKEKLEVENKTREETGNKYEEKMKNLTSENLSLRDKNKLLEVNMSKLQNDEIKTMSKLVAEKESEIEELRNELEEKSKKQAEQIKEQEKRIVENVRVYEEKINALNSKIHDLSEQESKGKSENEKLKNKVSGLEAENQKYVSENKKCKSEIVDLIESVEDLEEQKNALLNDNDKLKNNLNKLREEIEVEMTKSGTFSNSNNELNDRIQDLMKENERMKNDLEEEKERVAFLNARNEKAASDFKKTLQTRLDQIDTLEQDFHAQKSKLRARVAQLESENKLLQNRTNNVDSKLFDVQVSRRKELENEFRDLESKYISLMHTNDTDRIEKLNMEKKIAKLQSQLEETENKNEKLNSYINEVEQIKQAIGDKLKNQNDSFYKMLQEYRDENFALKEKINALNDSIEDKKKENSDVEKSIGDLTNKNEKLEKEIKELQQSYDQEKDKLNQQNSQLIQDIKNLNEKTKVKDEELALTRNNIKKLTESAKDAEKKLKDLDMQYKKESKQYKDDIAKLTELNSSLENKLGNLKFTNDGEYICNHCTYDNCVCDENCLIKCNKVNQHLKTIGDLKMQLSYEQDRNRLLKEQNNKLQYNYDTFTGEYNELFDSLKNYRTNIERLQKELYLNIDLLRNKDNELMSIKGNNASLVEDNKNLKKMCEKLQSKSFFTREHKTSKKVYEESIAIEKTLRFEAEDQIKRLREEIEYMAKTNATNLSKFNEVKRRNNEIENEMNLVRKEFIDMRKLYNEALQSNERLQRELKDERIIRQHSSLFTK